jgi:hypothetical protein
MMTSAWRATSVEFATTFARAQIVGNRERAVDDELMIAVEQVARHVRAHDAEADETDVCHMNVSLLGRNGTAGVRLRGAPRVRGRRRVAASRALPSWWCGVCIRSRRSRRNRAGRAARTGTRS